MTLLGVVRNPRSRRNKGRPLGAMAGIGDDVILREPASQDELHEVVREFAGRGITALAIDGGDGTVRDVLSAAETHLPTCPPVAFLASGKTNILAASAGTWGHGRPALERLVAASRTGFAGCRRQRISTLRARFTERSVTGFVLGAGVYRRATTLADQGVADRMSLGHARIATGIGRALALLARGEERRLWLAGTEMGVGLDGASAAPPHPRFIFLATALPRFTLGIWPFWNTGAGPLAYLDVDAPPRRLSAAILPALRGRPAPWMREAGYRSGSARRIELAIGEAFVLDGESFSPGPDNRVSIEAGPRIEFVAP